MPLRINLDFDRQRDEAERVYQFGDESIPLYRANDETQTFDKIEPNPYGNDGELPEPEMIPDPGNPEKRKHDLIARNPQLVYRLTGDPEAGQLMMETETERFRARVLGVFGQEALDILKPEFVVRPKRGGSGQEPRLQWRDQLKPDLLFQVRIEERFPPLELNAWYKSGKNQKCLESRRVSSLDEVLGLIEFARSIDLPVRKRPEFRAIYAAIAIAWSVNYFIGMVMKSLGYQAVIIFISLAGIVLVYIWRRWWDRHYARH